MRLLAACLLIPLVSLAVAAAPVPRPVDRPKDDDARTIVGTWEAVRGVKEGTPAPAREIQGLKMVFTTDSVRFQKPNRNGLRPQVAAYKLDTRAKPRQIDLTLILTVDLPGGQAPVVKLEGIYKVEKGQLTICFSKNRGARPTTFDEKTCTVLVLRKEKAKK